MLDVAFDKKGKARSKTQADACVLRGAAGDLQREVRRLPAALPAAPAAPRRGAGVAGRLHEAAPGRCRYRVDAKNACKLLIVLKQWLCLPSATQTFNLCWVTQLSDALLRPVALQRLLTEPGSDKSPVGACFATNRGLDQV